MSDMVTLMKNQDWKQAMILGCSSYYGDKNDDHMWADLLDREKFNWQTMNSFAWGSIALLIQKHQNSRREQTQQLIRIVSNSFEFNNFNLLNT